MGNPIARPAPRLALRAAAALRAPATLTSESTTWAPWAARSWAISRPKPWAAPVTMATLPATLPAPAAAAFTARR